jgi:hypothetical protein
MATQKLLIAAQEVFAGATLAGVERNEPIDEAELCAMRQRIERVFEQIVHATFIKQSKPKNKHLKKDAIMSRGKVVAGVLVITGVE